MVMDVLGVSMVVDLGCGCAWCVHFWLRGQAEEAVGLLQFVGMETGYLFVFSRVLYTT